MSSSAILGGGGRGLAEYSSNSSADERMTKAGADCRCAVYLGAFDVEVSAVGVGGARCILAMFEMTTAGTRPFFWELRGAPSCSVTTPRTGEKVTVPAAF